MFEKERRTTAIIPFLFGVILCLVGCGGMAQEREVSTSEQSVVTGGAVNRATSGGAIEEKAAWDNVENEEQITVGSEQIALRQGDTKDSTLVIRMREGKEEILATFDIRVKDCHIEPFEKILGYDGFRFFVKEDVGLNPYGAEVYYVGLSNDKAKVLFENHAKYNEKSGKYTASFEEEIKDFDGDGVREVVSNISYYVDGGTGAVVYDCEEGQVYVGDLMDLFDLEEDAYYVGRATDIGSWYNSESKKVTISYMEGNKKAHRSREKSYALDLSKIEMEEDYTLYVSDELKDLWKYEDEEEE